jgi:hypothetical protein
MIEAIAAIIFGATGIVLVIIIGIRGHRENNELMQRNLDLIDRLADD